MFGEGWKHVLFNLAKDPGEKHDLSHSEPDVFDRMTKLEKQTFDKLPLIAPYGGIKIKGGKTANGPMGPPKTQDAEPQQGAAK